MNHCAVPVRRGFADVHGRQVHFRYSGSGSPIVLVHQSPRSSLELEPLLGSWGRTHLCIAPDTPGFGYSEPLPESAGLAEFGAALIEFLDRLSLPRVCAYGVHSGAAITLAAALTARSRFSGVALHGLPSFTAADRLQFKERYFPAFLPHWSGQHLAWLWSRLREQRVFFPWYENDNEHRLPWDQASPRCLHEEALDFLRAGDSYRAGYAAAFEAGAELLVEIPTPLLIVASEEDVLAKHLPLFREVASEAQVELATSWAAAEDCALGFLAERAAPITAFRPPATRHRFAEVKVSGLRQCIHYQLPEDEPQALILHEPGGCALTALERRGDQAGAVALDLPGHGFSDLISTDFDGPEAYSSLVTAVMEASGLELEQLETVGASHALAAPIAKQTGLRRHRSVGPVRLLRPEDQGRLLPDLRPDSVGSHLLRAWQAVRDSELFDPWYEPTAANAVAVGDLDVQHIASRHLALLEAPGAKRLLSACLSAAGVFGDQQ